MRNELQKEIMKLLRWNEEELQLFVFECGIAYLEAYFINDAEAVNIISTKKEFWNWFQNQWQYRDQAFVECDIDDVPLLFIREMYKALHKPEILACEIYPSRVILGDNFFIVKMQA